MVVATSVFPGGLGQGGGQGGGKSNLKSRGELTPWHPLQGGRGKTLVATLPSNAETAEHDRGNDENCEHHFGNLFQARMFL